METVGKWVITPIYSIYKYITTHLLTIDPNFLGHLSEVSKSSTSSYTLPKTKANKQLYPEKESNINGVGR